MPVQLVLDYFAIDNRQTLTVANTDSSIHQAQQHVRQHLVNQSAELLLVRLSNPALYERFSYLEGLDNVLPTQQVVPRLLLAAKLKCFVPDYLTDTLIVSLGLLDKEPPLTTDCFETQLLSLCGLDLTNSCEFYAFFDALAKQPKAFFSLLAIESIADCLHNHLLQNLKLQEETVILLLEQLQQQPDITAFFHQLAYQQHLLQLRQLNQRYELAIALPAQTLPTTLLNLPLLPLAHAENSALPDKFLTALHSISRKILANELPAKSLADLLIADWSKLWTELEHLVELNPSLISESLAEKVALFDSEEATRLAKKLQQASYPLLPANAGIDDVLIWSQGYFVYCRQAFLYQHPLDEAINHSFSDWLLMQPARISRSNADWHFCSQQIHSYLQTGYLVVVIMVDALSALNQDVLLDELQHFAQQEHLLLSEKILFAPLPTLTEVGKMAVLTGKPAAQLPNDQQKALLETYQAYLPETQSLKIIRSWQTSSEHLENETNLLVYFENRLDERLHDCIHYEKHRQDLKPITSQLKTSMQRWHKDAMSLCRDIVFFITADHGMTVTQTGYKGQSLGQIHGRTFKLNQSQTELPPEFVKIDNYAVPKTRLHLTENAPLTHGGLTPEEVLIPFITLTSKPPQPTQTPLEISLSNPRCRTQGYCSWQLELTLNSRIDVDSIAISLDLPFSGKATLDSLRAGKTQTLILHFTSHQMQEGLIEMGLQVTYHRAGANEKNQKLLAVEFPPSLLEKDNASQSFEDMF